MDTPKELIPNDFIRYALVLTGAFSVFLAATAAGEPVGEALQLHHVMH